MLVVLLCRSLSMHRERQERDEKSGNERGLHNGKPKLLVASRIEERAWLRECDRNEEGSDGAGGVSRQILGTVVIGGMLAATLLAIFLVPVTFSIAERFSNLFSRGHDGAPAQAIACPDEDPRGGGSTSLADVRQAEQLYYTAEAAIPNLESQIVQLENSLALLLGRDPGPIARGQDIADAHPEAVPVGLPSDRVERRPDVRRAEQLLVQANANIGVARAQYFPQFSLSGEGGVSSNQLAGLVASKNAYYCGWERESADLRCRKDSK
jgi:hypothetical protein